MKASARVKFGFALLIVLVAFVLWRWWIPNVTSFEAPSWDESDRSRDALLIFKSLRAFNPFPLLMHIFFFQTWGPLFGVLAQIPLVLFGPSALSLTFVSFCGFFFAVFGTFAWVRARLGVSAACAVSAFAFAWLVSAPAFAPFYLLMVLEAWVVCGWLGLAVAGALDDVELAVVASWILFATKYQYYPIFFFAFLVVLVSASRARVWSFVVESLKPWTARVLFALVALLVLHVLIMKTVGPVYGEPSWNQPRALRNPVLIAFILGCLLLWTRREVFVHSFVTRAWEETYIKWFMWPASILMASPWPNRWAGVMVTQDFQKKSYTPLQTVSIYASELAEGLSWPTVSLSVLAILLLSFIATFVLRRRSRPDFKSLGFFVFVLFVVQIFVLLVAVKNLQIRFAFAVYMSIPVGVVAYFLAVWRSRVLSAVVFAVSVAFIAVAFRPAEFFLGHLHDYTNETYFQHTDLYPLDRSLGPVVAAVGHRPVRFGIIQEQAEWRWDRPMQIWPLEYEMHTGVASEAFTYTSCATAAADHLDLILQAVGSKWETVTCASK